jgi:hypothetical protein
LPLLLLAYVLALLCLACFPWTQALLIYLHWVKLPPFKNLLDLRAFRLSNARNIKVRGAALAALSSGESTSEQVHTHDGETLHGWHLLPYGELTVQASKLQDEARDEFFDRALSLDHPVFIFFHG